VESDSREQEVAQLGGGERRVIADQGRELFGGDAGVVERWCIESRCTERRIL
jgi:hypothetical protein